MLDAYLHVGPNRNMACDAATQDKLLEPFVTPGMANADLLVAAMAQLHRSRNALSRAGVEPSFIPEC